MALLDVVFRALNKAGDSFVELRREDGHGSAPAMPSFSRDFFPEGELLDAQLATVDDVLTFTFSAPVQLVYVFSADHQNHASMVDPFGGIPSANRGIPALPGVPMSFPVQTQQVKVFEQAGGSVTVWGYRYPSA